MNDHESACPKPGDDPILEELLAPLKHLQPPLETRIANRMAVAKELDSIHSGRRSSRLPWWRKSVPVPAPIVVTLVALAPLLAMLSFRGEQEPAPPRTVKPDRDIRRRMADRTEPVVAENRPPKPPAAPEYYQVQTYLCGIGQLTSESGYKLRSESHE